MAKNILIVDDSALMRRVLSDIIKTDNRLNVQAMATNGLEGFTLIVDKPSLFDVVILDINMPKMNGIEVLEALKKSRIKVNVVVVSTVAKEGADITIKALELGAFDFITKPENFILAKSDSFKEKFLTTICVAAGLTYQDTEGAKSTGVKRPVKSDTVEKTPVRPRQQNKTLVKGATKLVALACSTGGPKSLQMVIPKLPANLDASIVMVQHMPKGFTKSLAQRLNEMSEVKVKEAESGDILEKGCVYLAPGGAQMKIKGTGKGQAKIEITDDPPRDALKPSANIMYESLMDCDYDEITCVVLTGMGSDGTEGITNLDRKKNIYVISQDEKSCVVYGMPRTIAEAGLSDEVKPLNQIADAIIKKVGVR